MDIDEELEPLTVYSYDVSPALDTFIRQVLETIPDSYAEEFPSFSVFEAYSAWGAHVEEENVLMCDPSLLDLPKDIAIGTLAHEFAHVFCRHTGSDPLQQEDEADQLASKWGFKKEIKAMRQLYGPPTDGRRYRPQSPTQYSRPHQVVVKGLGVPPPTPSHPYSKK